MDRPALLELLGALRNADAADRIRQAAGSICQALIDAELTANPRRQHRTPRSPHQPDLVEPLSAQPLLMSDRPRLSAAVDNPLSQKQFRWSLPNTHQFGAAVLAGTHQMPRRLLLRRRHRNRHDPTRCKQPGQQCRVTRVGLDLVAAPAGSTSTVPPPYARTPPPPGRANRNSVGPRRSVTATNAGNRPIRSRVVMSTPATARSAPGSSCQRGPSPHLV
jgi:hypothetical protein